MRASRWLRHRAQMNRTRYAVRALASEVLPSLVGSMQTMNDTLRIQSRIMNDHLKFHHGSADPVQGDAKLRENSGGADATENHNEQEQR